MVKYLVDLKNIKSPVINDEKTNCYTVSSNIS
jgi:hypothetical protein